MAINFPSANRPLTASEIMGRISGVDAYVSKPEDVVATAPAAVTHDVTTIEVVTTRHGKYKDPESRKAYQRAHMAANRAQSGG